MAQEIKHELSDKESLHSFLAANNIPYETVDHEEVFTVEAMMKHADIMPGWHHKNLLLKSKKGGQLYLLVTRHNAEVS